MRLKGQRAIITGVNRSICAGIAREFAKEDADICFSYRSKKKEAKELEFELNSCGVKACALFSDLKDPQGADLFF
jgi:3-oxoacyl-[acyl-carrier protein] reductase